ncbi:6742_t:CDS:2 [Acaulospora colombiana]|uniref:6742_t:CDS:1 n=1 Tax=Acaulospora colombiana TaxID=27376 RepID=A0ACA9N647_9GLOM|nr:6742_t:CDS:2 [Acaulospora colombiana]
MALYPDSIVLMEFTPVQITTSFAILANSSMWSQRTAQRMARCTKSRLILVCRTWKQAIDMIKMNDKWVVDHTCSNQPGSTSVDTHQSSRLNLNCQVIHPISQFSIQWKYPVSAVSIRITHITDTDWVRAKSVKDLVSFPEQVRTLCIDLGKVRVYQEVITDIETMFIRLTTLHMILSNNSLLQRSLTIPTLMTLSLLIPRQTTLNSPLGVQWSFPALLFVEDSPNENPILVHFPHDSADIPPRLLPMLGTYAELTSSGGELWSNRSISHWGAR